MTIARTTVLVHNPDTQLPELVRAGQEIPSWATVSNPEAVEGGDPQMPLAMATGPDGFDPRREFAGLSAPPEGMTREQLIDAAANMGLRPGDHFPKSASKDVVWGAVKHTLET